MDIVYITDLKIVTIIGIYDWERNTKQTISVNLQMGTDISKAATSENIADALNYKAISKRLITFVETSEFFLIETMAEQIAKIVREEFGVRWLQLKLSKPKAVTGSKDTGVIIERGEKF